LNTVITSASKFFSSNHRLFIKSQENKVIGILKVGTKKLFVRDERANYYEINPLCVLDFYVHESEQRSGHGKALFEYMLQFEKVHPKNLAYDRPSPKLIKFLQKHYGLSSYVTQNNNFVVFNQYFEERKKSNITNNTDYSNSYSSRKDNNSNYNNRSPVYDNNNYSNPTSTYRNPTPTKNNLAQIGQQFISNQTPSQQYRSPTYSTPDKVFPTYYLNEQQTNYYDQIYSKKKLNMINDYINGGNIKDQQQFIKYFLINKFKIEIN
jgi:GNAT superfamily N-acetyltransferase